MPVTFVFEISVKARPWLTANELNPLVSDIFVQTTKLALSVAHVVAMTSGEEPSLAGPRYCGQSAAQTPTQHKRRSPGVKPFLRWVLGATQIFI
jgi:hypothetical protein